MRVIELRMNGFARKKMNWPITRIQKVSPMKDKVRTQQPMNWIKAANLSTVLYPQLLKNQAAPKLQGVKSIVGKTIKMITAHLSTPYAVMICATKEEKPTVAMAKLMIRPQKTARITQRYGVVLN